MSIIELASINHYHNQRQIRFGNSVETLGWKNSTSQQKRFEVLIQRANLNNAVILDVGCGYGDFKPFLDDHFSNFCYVGIDTNEQFIHHAKESYGHLSDTHFIHGDISTTEFKGIDFVFISGALSYQSEEKDFHINLLDQMYQTAQKGFAFNMLDDRFFDPHPMLKAHNREYILEHCKQWSGETILNDGYLLDDFTIFVQKSS